MEILKMKVRMSSLCPSIHSDLLQKWIVKIFNQLQKGKCNTRFYPVPNGISTWCSVFRCYATAKSLHVRGPVNGNQVSSVVGGSKKSQRKLLGDDHEMKLEELFSEIKSLIKMGNIDDALDLLEANYEAMKEQIVAGDKTIQEAAVLDVVALGYMAIGDFKMVKSILNTVMIFYIRLSFIHIVFRCLRIRFIITCEEIITYIFVLIQLDDIVCNLGDDEPLLDSILTHMGSMQSTLGRFEKSMLLYKRALEILERYHGNNSTSLVMPLLGMGKALGSAGRATKAVDVYNRIISILESNLGAESEEMVVPLNALGNLLIEQGKAEDAENPFMRIVGIYTKLYGKNDQRVGMAMCSLANAKCAKGDADSAIKLYKNALEVLEHSESMNIDDSILEKTRIDLAELLHVVGREEEGRELLGKCLSITKKYKGEEDPSFVTHITNLATSYSRSKNYVEAERLLRSSLEIMERNVGPDDPSVTFVMLQLAVTLYNMNRDEEAEQLALKVLRVREKAFGDASLPVGEALDCLICIQKRMGRDDGEILDLLKRNLSIQEKAFGGESEQVVETLKKIVFFMDKLGIKDHKSPFQRRLSLLRSKFKQQIQY